MKNIKIVEEVTFRKAATPEEGMPIYEKIISFLEKGEAIRLDFQQVELVTTAFLNVMIGRLYEKYTSEQLNKSISFLNLRPEITSRIKAVSETAKNYYKNQEQYNRDIESTLYGDN